MALWGTLNRIVDDVTPERVTEAGYLRLFVWRRALPLRLSAAWISALFIGLALALSSPAHTQERPSLSLTKTANPTTYSAVGDIITYTYVITNTSAFGLGVTLEDDTVAPADLNNCPGPVPEFLASGDSINCTGTYRITAADIEAGKVTNIATARGFFEEDVRLDLRRREFAKADAPTSLASIWRKFVEHLNPIGTAHAQGVAAVTARARSTVRFVPGRTTSITIVKKVVGGSGTFTFVSPTAALSMRLSTGNRKSSAAIALPPGTYRITERQDNSSFYLESISCRDPDGGTRVNVSSATAVIDLDANERIICTFTNVNPRKQTNAVIERFLHHRLTALLDNEPDRPRYMRRFPGSLWGGGPGDNSSPFSFSASDRSGRVAFSTSLGEIRNALASADQTEYQAMALSGTGRGEQLGPLPRTGLDIWTEAHFTAFDDDIGGANADGNVDILYFGADIPLTTNVLVGVLAQFDWAEESTKVDASKISGDGWMAGPYLSARLSESLFFDWRAAWGTSDNSVSPVGTYTDNFDTDRWLTTARISGNWTSGNWRMTPSASFKYAEEDQKAYTDSNGIRIFGQTASLGRVEFGPEFGYRWELAGGGVIEPHVSLVGVWNFEDSGSFFVADTLVTPDDFTGRLEGGAMMYLPGGWAVRGTAAYDGMGTDYEAITGKVWLNVPLN